MTLRSFWRNYLMCITLAGTLGCQTTEEKTPKAETSMTEKEKQPDSLRKAELDQLGQEKMAKTKNGEDCDLTVIAKTSHAVGDPCQTTREFMKSLGLSEEKPEAVEKIAEQLKERGASRPAH